jgi:hypothetical protein
MTRTFGAALGALIVLLFLADVATSLSGPGSDSLLTARAATSDR